MRYENNGITYREALRAVGVVYPTNTDNLNCLSMEQLTFDFIDEIVPIPECSGLMAMSGYKTPQALADEMVREARIWQKRNPGKDVMEVITPDWKEYINHKIKELC